MSIRGAIARRELGAISREKTIVLALIIQLFVAAFSSFLVVGLAALYDPGSAQSSTTIQGAVVGEASDELLAASEEVDGLALRRYPSTAAARDDLGGLGAPVSVVFVTSYTDDGRIAVDVTAAEGLQTTLVVVQVREVLEALERAERVERSASLESEVVPLPPASGASPYYGFTYTILLPLLLFLPAFISGSLAVDAITEEIERKTMTLLRVTPASLVAIVDGKALAMTVLVPAQVLLWFGLLVGVNDIAIANLPALLALVTALALVVVTIGVVVGVVTRDRQRAQLLYSMGILVVFGGATVLPEHPATTVARLAIDSATTTTWALLAGYVVLAVGGYALARVYVGQLDPEGL